MKRIFCSFFLLFNIFVIHHTWGQDVCSRSLNEAEDRLELGHFYEIPAILESCLKNGFSKEEKIRAYRLLTLAYLYLDYQDKADSVYLKLLRLSPEYDPSISNEPAEYINHHLQFTTRPNISFVFKTGLNLTRPSILAHYSLSNSAMDVKKISPLLSFQLGFGSEITITNNLHVGIDFLYTKMRFEVEDKLLEEMFYKPQIKNVRQEWEIPIYAKYVLWWKKWSPFVLGGISPNSLIDASMQDLQGSYTRTAEDEQLIRPVASTNVSAFRRQFNYSLMAGFGVQYKIGINYLICEARYNIGMFNAVKEADRWRLDLANGRDLKFYPSVYVDDDYRINQLSIMISYIKPLYNPRKIKSKN